MIWANATQDKISSIINPVILDFYNKKNLRSLSNSELIYLEDLKTNILLNIIPYTRIDNDVVLASFANAHTASASVLSNYYSWLQNLKSDIGRDLSVEEIKQAKTSYYSMVYSTEDNTGE
jgi:hypothetical protein